MFGAGLKLIYGDKIGDYVEKAMCWNIEEYASVNPQEIPKDVRHKDYEEWLLSNPHLCWPLSQIVTKQGRFHMTNSY